jgi:hypothetical protein
MKEDRMFNRHNSRFLSAIGISILILGLGLAAQEEKRVPPKLDGAAVTPVFDSGRFQSRIKGPQGVGVLAGDLSLYGKGGQAMGFAAKSEEAKTFLIGSFYSEALAYVRGGKPDLALERLKAMDTEFIAMGAPNSVHAFVSRIENFLATKTYEPAVLLDFLSLFQPVYEDYLLSKGKDRLTLFQAGSWLMDMGLAAAAKDKSLLKQPQVLSYFVAEMKRMDAPKGVQDSLAEISNISAKKEIADRDAEQVLKLIKRIQSVLG